MCRSGFGHCAQTSPLENCAADQKQQFMFPWVKFTLTDGLESVGLPRFVVDMVTMPLAAYWHYLMDNHYDNTLDQQALCARTFSTEYNPSFNQPYISKANLDVGGCVETSKLSGGLFDSVVERHHALPGQVSMAKEYHERAVQALHLNEAIVVELDLCPLDLTQDHHQAMVSEILDGFRAAMQEYPGQYAMLLKLTVPGDFRFILDMLCRENPPWRFHDTMGEVSLQLCEFDGIPGTIRKLNNRLHCRMNVASAST